jgi:phage terminase small subunit
MARKTQTLPPPPDHLSDRAKGLWCQIAGRRGRSPERLALLQAGLEALDRADEAREILAKEGLTSTTKSTGAVHVHPLAKVERECRQQFVKVWHDLNLTWSNDLDGNGYSVASFAPVPYGADADEDE